MTWTYADLKAALPTGVSDAEAAALLNAETEQAVVDVQTVDARQVLLESGEWGGVVMLAASTPSASLPAQLVGAAIVVRDTLTLTTSLRTSDDGVVARITALLGALGPQGADVLSDATVSTLLGMRNVTRPVWQPAVTVEDIQQAGLV